MNPANHLPDHPHPDQIRRFLVGDLPEADIERLGHHLGECVACHLALPDSILADPLVIALRGPLELEPHAGEPECQATIESLVHGLVSGNTGLGPPRTASDAAGAAIPDTTASPVPHGPAAVPDDQFGSLPCFFGRYQILECLAEGGMGAVYLAHDTTLDRKVALKVCRLQRAEGPRAHERFLREAQAAAALQHEGICRVLDFGVQGQIPFLTMDFISGRPLSRLLKTGQPLNPAWAAGLVYRVAQALEAAHRQGVIHRDLKPANIMLDERDQPRVVDFGLARREQDGPLTQPGTVLGTPAYMSPEQVEGKPVDPRTDIYSLGVILYELLTGRRPFAGPTFSQLMYQIVHGDLLPPSTHRLDLDPCLEAVCLKALARSPDGRQATMAELATSLEPYRASGDRVTPSSAPPAEKGAQKTCPPAASLPSMSPALPSTLSEGEHPTTAPATGRWRRVIGAVAGHPWAAGLAVLALMGAGVLGYFAFLAPPEPEPFKGWIDVRVWEEGNPDRLGLRLNQDGALPLRARDKIRVEARLNRPGFLYVFWIDTAGRALPLYPWKPGHWEERPADEQPVTALDLPTDESGGWEIERGKAGMETLVMLVRDTPLPLDVNLRELLADLPAQTMQNTQAVVWFENGAVVHGETDRGPNLFNVQKIDDPVMQTQRLLKRKLGPLCAYSRAVSFANKGK
jgi:hypothetical protein